MNVFSASGGLLKTLSLYEISIVEVLTVVGIELSFLCGIITFSFSETRRVESLERVFWPRDETS